MRPRRRAFALLGGAVLLFVVGTSVQAGWLLVLASCLLGAVLAGCALPRRMTRGVEVVRRPPAEAFQGEEVRVDLAVSNRSRGVRLALELVDEHVAPVRAFLPVLAPGETVVLETRRQASRRGVHEDTDLVLGSSAPFGVASARRRVRAPGRTIVYPRIEPLDDLSFLGPAPTPEPALHTAPRRGGGPEYLGIREYRTGDSLRHVHWRSTARHGQVMVREFEREQTRRLVVVVDAVADAGPGEPETPLDRCCSIAASLSFAARGAGQGVRLVAAADGRPISLARAEPHEILRWLAELRPGGGLPLGELLDTLGREVLGAETLVLVAPTWRANAAEALGDRVADLARRVPAVIAIVVDVEAFSRPGSGSGPGSGPGSRRAPRLSGPETDALEASLHEAGAWVVRVGAGDDLRRALDRVGAR